MFQQISLEENAIHPQPNQNQLNKDEDYLKLPLQFLVLTLVLNV